MFLRGEGADDAGGVFDETIAEMCTVSFKSLFLIVFVPLSLSQAKYYY